MIIPRKWKTWARGLLGGCIGGGAGAITSWLTLTGAKSLGLEVPTLNLQAVGVVFLGGILTHGALFLAKSPLPEPTTGDTDYLTKPKP